MSRSKIEWTERTWNPVTGCTKVSEGCRFCYAEAFAKRLQAMVPKFRNGFALTIHENLFDEPTRWKKPSLVFVNSMSDLFHEYVPVEVIKRLFTVMAACTQHTFQVLTKRSQRLKELSHQLHWPQNVWMGVSVESARYLFRLNDLRAVPAAVRFVSFEPLLGPIESPDLSGIHWAIVGGESGPHARPMQPEWVDMLLRACRDQNVAFFFKQWGGRGRDKGGNLLNGHVVQEWPNGFVPKRQ